MRNGARSPAHVVLAPGHDGDPRTVKDLQEHVKKMIAPFQYPRSVIFASTPPKTRTGKIQRFPLRRPDGAHQID